MAYINKDKLDLAIQEIKQFCSSYQSELNDVVEQTVEVSNANASFGTFDGCFISGSLDETDEVTSSGVKKKVVDKIFVSSSNISEYCNLILQEKEELDERINSVIQSLNSMNESLEVIAMYLLQVDSILEDGTTVSLCDRLKSVSQLMEDDKNNGYEFLHSTPILEDGEITFYDVNYDINDDSYIEYNGKYLKFFNEYGVKVYAPMARFDGINPIPYTDAGIEQYSDIYIKYYVDIMKSQERFTELHKDSIRNTLDTLVLQDSFVNIIEGLLNGGTTLGVSTISPDNSLKKNITMSMYDVLKKPYGDNYYTYVDTYTHETAHVLDYYLGLKKGMQWNYSSSDEYQEYYNILCNSSHARSLLRNYAFENSAENFAESVAEYYGNYGSDGYFHFSPSDLQDIDVCAYPIFLMKVSSDEQRVTTGNFGQSPITVYDVFANILLNGNMSGISFNNEMGYRNFENVA